MIRRYLYSPITLIEWLAIITMFEQKPIESVMALTVYYIFKGLVLCLVDLITTQIILL